MPVVGLQIRMAALAKDAHENGHALQGVHWDYDRRWEALGYPAFAAMLAVFYLMVHKPVFWG